MSRCFGSQQSEGTTNVYNARGLRGLKACFALYAIIRS
jgi:hypothetical protein